MENGKNRLQQAQDEVEEVKSKAFSKSARKVKQQKWYEHRKMKVLLIAVGVVIAAIIIGIIAWLASGSDDREQPAAGQPTSGP
ncbi:unnamed protein product [Coregonus sp. 'balchen']|nr:unnamed protein product [Coregonus sp. 'balchen']